jgi:hypothetical protein
MTITTKSGKTYERRAWTGGDVPIVTSEATRAFKELRSAFFRESLRECGGLDLWKCAGTGSSERVRIFWNRASLDAWRTLTN